MNINITLDPDDLRVFMSAVEHLDVDDVLCDADEDDFDAFQTVYDILQTAVPPRDNSHLLKHKFTYSHLTGTPKDDEDTIEWSFSCDFRGDLSVYFPKCTTNYEITDVLVHHDVFIWIPGCWTDPESSCSYFYFTDLREAKAFIDRLNGFLANR